MIDQEFTETSEVIKYPGKGGWFYILLPKIYIELSEEFFGKKFSPIIAKVGNTTWQTSIFPSKRGGSFIAIKADIRKAENINEGDKITIKFRFKH